jgi:tetratricopeptide (TPR) repeat protein
LLATTYAAAGRPAEAIAELNAALLKNPRHYWSLFQRGLCYQERGEYALAVADFSSCTALWPEFAWGHYNRGWVLHLLEKKDQALRDFTAALQQDPELVHAYLSRGLLLLDSQRHGAALKDFDAAAARGMDSVTLHAGRGIALEHLDRFKEADAAFRRAWQRDPDNVRMLLGYGFAVAERLPDQARAAFTKVLRREPRNPKALYGCAKLYTKGAPGSQQALTIFTRALEIDPTFVDARRARAVVLAHRGEGEWARQDIDWCVAADPTGATLYAAACVYALGAEQSLSSTEAHWMADRAVVLLREAFALGYGKEQAAKDTDLRGIWGHAEFRRLVRK